MNFERVSACWCGMNKTECVGEQALPADEFCSGKTWPIPMEERLRLAAAHEPKASASPDGFRLATCVVCERPMVAMWHCWVEGELPDGRVLVKEIHVCHACATDIYGAPTPDEGMKYILDQDEDARHGMGSYG